MQYIAPRSSRRPARGTGRGKTPCNRRRPRHHGNDCSPPLSRKDPSMSLVDRRQFVQRAGAATAGLALPASLPAAPAPDKPLKFRLGIVTYNVAANWDRPTLLRVCKNVGLSPVELRTTHKHGVEPSLSPAERQEVKK